MEINFYLNFDGNCRAAFDFYHRTLGGEITLCLTHGESPMADQVDPTWRDRIMHVCLMLGDRALMGSDTPPGCFEGNKGFAVSLHMSEPAEAERVFKALAENATITMPLQETFWAHRFGMLNDQFGVPWMVNCAKTPERSSP